MSSIKHQKVFCRNCKGLRNYKVLHEASKHTVEDEGFWECTNEYSLIECSGCNTISFLHVYSDSEMAFINDQSQVEYYDKVSIFPPYLEHGREIEQTHFLPERIRQIYNETILSFKANSFILTAGGLRGIIEATCNHLEIKKGNLAERIDQLYKKGHLTLNESKRLHSIRFMGNDALHEIETPKKEQLYLLLDIVNHLLDNLFISDRRMKGNIDMIIDNYEDFYSLLVESITENQIKLKLTLKAILGRSIRLIAKQHLEELENKLRKEINEGEIDFISIENNQPEYYYKVVKEPIPTFNF
ncbi:hypothetical protein PbJCM13498_12310 [Prolixibacter bellariivorans]|uniref:DUF4145 domain-containing protein n=1 Tax=Prolixibacter bellariivorans TaxID=314319 RepID=A0A5M4AXG4_9BACT|nr:DUF4145 domain-containing protein [Prolixibacter bellariivorans]GET32368.1 hypothetical protein PbJCM13498_12310 [Prolixibacter bellariivorans]